MRKKIIIVLLSIISAICLCISFSACSNSNSSSNNSNISNSSSQSNNTEAATNTHILVYVSEVSATCTTDGNIAYWYCEYCGEYFSDENGTTEISSANTVVAAKGHNYDDDYVCVNCGKHDKESLLTAENERHEAKLTELYSSYIGNYNSTQTKINSYNSQITTTSSVCSSKISSLSSTIATLKTQIAVAKLDTSAAGKAKLKKLQSELETYQEEYDYYVEQSSLIKVRDQYKAQLNTLTNGYNSSVKSENKLHETNLATINGYD